MKNLTQKKLLSRLIAFSFGGMALCAQPFCAVAANVDFEVSAGAEQDSNLNIVELDKNSNESDTALLLNAKVDASGKPAEKLNLSGGYAFTSKTYQNHNEFDLAIHQLYADANYEFSLLTAGASHHFAKAQLDGSDFLDLHQTSLYISKLINNTIYLRAAVNSQDKQFAKLSDRNAKNNGYSGDAFVFFNDGKTFVNIGVNKEKENARAKQFDYQGVTYKAKASHKFTALGKDNKLQLGWRYTTKDYSGITPEIKAERYDSGHAVDINWEVSLTPRVSIETKVEHGKYNSNFASADYSDTRASIAIKARF
ncbi:hypothetical protein [Cellvibrio zantedeschiae]|nr:hypothetical protein [Cellvibrio zantedeschiae]